ncbi:MAG: hypothetical protein M3Y64_02700 [Gemmatimonadota bacterium]|nr:hypothetical protein [Gemmatimonadota bacterium]
MKYEELNVGAHVIYVHTQREMTVKALNADDETVTCEYVDGAGNTQETRMAPRFLELMRDGGLMDNV